MKKLFPHSINIFIVCLSVCNDNNYDYRRSGNIRVQIFRVTNVRVSNFHHKVQEVKIIHGVFYFHVLNFRRPRER